MGSVHVFGRQKKRKLHAEINVVPFIDIVLVLLVVFMAVSPSAIKNTIKVELPKVTKTTKATHHNRQWIVTINKRGKVFVSNNLRSKATSKKPISIKKLHYMIKSHRNKDKLEIYIRADKRVLYGKVVTLMSAIEKTGVSRVGLITKSI